MKTLVCPVLLVVCVRTYNCNRSEEKFKIEHKETTEARVQ